ncbi:hypothetical protein Aduo_016514 [Ancylostoma duodenale]
MSIEQGEQPTVVNVERTGYFRQNYDTRGWQNIIKQMKKNHKIYHERTRSGLISDAFAAAQVDRLDYETVFQLLEYLPKEKSGSVWRMVEQGLGTIVAFYGNEPGGVWAKSYAKKIMKIREEDIHKNIDPEEQKVTAERMPGTTKKMLSKEDTLSVEAAVSPSVEQRSRRKSMELNEDYTTSDSSLDEFLERSFIESYCELGSKNCSSTFRSIFEREVYHRCGDGQKASQCVRVRRHFRGCTYCYGVKELGATALEKVKNLYKIENAEEEKENLRKGMSCVEDVRELKQQLLSAIDGTADIRMQDIAFEFREVSKNPVAQEFMLTFLIENWELIYERFGGQFKPIERVLRICLGKIRSYGQIMMVRQFQRNAPNASKFRVIDQQIEAAEHRIAWYKKHSKKLAEYFESHSS